MNELLNTKKQIASKYGASTAVIELDFDHTIEVIKNDNEELSYFYTSRNHDRREITEQEAEFLFSMRVTRESRTTVEVLNLKDRIVELYNNLKQRAVDLQVNEVDDMLLDLEDIYMCVTFDLDEDGEAWNPFVNECIINANSDDLEYEITEIAQLIINTL